MDFRKLHDIIPFLIIILGIYMFSLGIVSIIYGMRLENISFFQFHVGGTISIFIGILMIFIGNGLKAKTRISWYFAIFLILLSLFSISIRKFNLIYFDMIGIFADIFILSILLKYRKGYIFPWLSIEREIALLIIFMSIIYGVTGTLLLGEQFKPPIRDIYTAIYYAFSILTTLGVGDILPTTNASRLFTISVAILGIASFLGAITTFSENITEKMGKLIKK